jgi:gp16 family phage-associated protein
MVVENMEALAKARQAIEAQGLSVRAWARRNGFAYTTVHQILAGDRRARIGVGHLIAVKLGVKAAAPKDALID